MIMNKSSEDAAQIKKLIALNDELENYFRNTVIPQLFVDANYRLRKFTPPAMKQFNLKISDVGKHITELDSNIRFPTLEENIKEVIDSKIDLEKEIQTTDRRWFQMNILPYIIQKENKPNGVIITFIDITDRIQNLKEIEKLNADHETFIYSVSHDLKTPILNIEALVNAWKETKDKASEESASMVEMISSSVGNVKKIIDELGDITRTRFNLTKESERVSFENILEDVKITLKEKIRNTGTVITTEINASEINFIRKNLRSILYNLLMNAIKYKAPDRKPEIFIKTEKLEDYILLSVKDNGLGIAENKKSMIFSEFARISNHVEGSGIGLYIISRMVQAGGGKIELESISGQGSTFKIYFKIH
jgi:two-component system, OmpR family, phosphate regulon sensor histidine kinase PhoR